MDEQALLGLNPNADADFRQRVCNYLAYLSNIGGAVSVQKPWEGVWEFGLGFWFFFC